MTAEIVQLVPDEVGDEYRFDPDAELEAAKGKRLQSILIIGQTEDGGLYIGGNLNAGGGLVLMEMAKHALVFGS